MKNLSNKCHPLFSPDSLKQFESSSFDHSNIKKHDIPGVTKKDKPCFILSNVLTPEECKALIELSEKRGFEKAETFCHYYRDRYNDRLISDDKYFTDFIWNRVKSFMPEKCDGWDLHSLNYRWRFCKYLKGNDTMSALTMKRSLLWSSHRWKVSSIELDSE